MSRRLLLLLVLLAPLARAAPLQLTHQGYLLDANDTPVSQTQVEFVFRLYNARVPGDVTERLVWESSTCRIDVLDGLYATLLGSEDCNGSQPLDDAHFSASESRFLEVHVGAQKLLPRLAITAVPTASLARRASRADDAAKLDGKSAAYFTDAANLTGTLGAAISYEGAAIADARIASASSWNARVTDVSATGPLAVASSGTARELSIGKATGEADGYLAATDFARFDAKIGSAAAPLALAGTALSIAKADANTNGYLAKADFARFEAKAEAAGGSLSGATLSGATLSGTTTVSGTTTLAGATSLSGTTTISGATTLGAPLTIAAGGSISGLVRKAKAVLVKAPMSSKENWDAMVGSGLIDATDGRTTYAPGGVDANAATLAAGDFDVYVYDHAVWAASDYNEEQTIYTLWKRHGRNVITIGNDSSASLYPIRETVTLTSAVYATAGDPGAYHPITEDLRSDAPGANGDGIIYISRAAPDFLALYTVKGQAGRPMILVGESESGGVWLHDQTGYALQGPAGARFLKRVLEYMTASTARMAAARARSRAPATALSTDIKRSPLKYTWTTLIANWTSNYYSVCGAGYHVCGLTEAQVRAYAGGARQLGAGTYWTMGSISREGDATSTTGVVASWWAGTPALNCTAGYHWVLPIYFEKAAAYHAPGCQPDASSLNAACCADY